MLKLIAIAASAVTLAVLTPAQAHGAVLRLPHKPFKTMTKTQKVHYLKLQRAHDNSIIRFWRNHRELMNADAGSQVKWAKQSLVIVQRNLHKLLAVAHYSVSSGVRSALLCIHGYEGSWTDPNAPYWGGLQMDMNFQRAYGPEFLSRYGTADHWPVWAQLEAGMRAVKARGYSPWPNTARYCGLL